MGLDEARSDRSNRSGSCLPALGLLLAAAGACRGPVDPEPAPRTACTSLQTVAVGPGLAPSISWTPDCGLGSVSVYQVGDTVPTWAVFSPDNQLPSPIVYGVAPPAAEVTGPAPPLVRGLAYRAILGVLIQPPVGSSVLFVTALAQQDFTP